MEKVFITWCAALFSAVSVYSQAENSLLWKIERSDLAAPSYLYGTMHSRDERAHQFGDSVMAKFSQCEAVALELLTSSMKEDPFSFLNHILMKDTTLDMLLSEDDYKMVKEFAEENLGIYSMFIDKLMPVFTSTLITELSMGKEMEVSVDEFFEKVAGDSGKKLIALETMEEQLRALSRISLKDQAEMLVEHLKETKEASEILEQLMQHYQAQNLQGMMEVYNGEKVPAMFDEALVKERNKILAHRIDSLVHLHSTFVAVGALHLVGKEGIIQLLQKKSYSVKPVFSVPAFPVEKRK